MTKIRPIRLSDEEWNELLRKSVETGYQNRTEYIRAMLEGDKLWSSKQPPAEIEPELYTYKVKWQDAIASLEVYTNDAARFLARAEAAEAKIEQLQSELQAAKQLAAPIPAAKQLPLTTLRPPFQTILDTWTDKERKEWTENKWKGFAEHWCRKTLDTAYSLMDHGA